MLPIQNTERMESPSAFVIRFREAWEQDLRLPVDNSMKALFINMPEYEPATSTTD